MKNKSSSPSLGTWALLLGGTGFVCGFLGPIALNPDANQGPLLGLFLFVGLGPAGESWPPTDLQHFLNLSLLDPLPGRYRALLDD